MNQLRRSMLGSGPEQNTRLAILLILITTVMFALLDTGVKYVGQFYPVLQIAWARYVFQMVVVPVVIGGARPRDIIRTKRPGLQVLRSMMMVGATLSFFTAVRYMPVAEASAIGMISPLLVTALAIPLLGERVGRRRWMAVLCGLIGALVIIRPGFGALSWAALLPVVTAVCYALYQITTRMLAEIDPPITTFFYSGAVGVVVLSLAVPFSWQTPTVGGWAMMIALGLLAGVGHYCVIQAMRRAPASVLAPVSFVQLVWVVILGYLVFGDFPDKFTFLGAAIVVGSSGYVFYRENVVKRAAKTKERS
ncbi:MAG: DMT family transporter [Proteobacteria bacterium]|nr:DMT family transporter [Pseudomonadota bacterium]